MSATLSTNDLAVNSVAANKISAPGVEPGVTYAKVVLDTIPVTVDNDTEVTIVQPAGSVLLDLTLIPHGDIVTDGNPGDDLVLKIGTISGVDDIVAAVAILENTGAPVAWRRLASLPVISHGAGADTHSFAIGHSGRPATNGAVTVISENAHADTDRNIHVSLMPVGNPLVTADTEVTVIAKFVQV